MSEVPIESVPDPDPGRLEAVEERIEEAKRAADVVEEREDLGLHHRDGDDHGAFEPSSDEPEDAAPRDDPRTD